MPGGEQSGQAARCAVPPRSEETPGAIPGARWHRLARGSTGGSRGGQRWEAASARGQRAAGGWFVHPHPAVGTAPHGAACGAWDPHAHRQPGPGGGCHVGLLEPHRVAGGNTGAPEQGPAVAGAAGDSAGWASWDITAGVWGQPGLPRERRGSRAGHRQPPANLRALPSPRGVLRGWVTRGLPGRGLWLPRQLLQPLLTGPVRAPVPQLLVLHHEVPQEAVEAGPGWGCLRWELPFKRGAMHPRGAVPAPPARPFPHPHGGSQDLRAPRQAQLLAQGEVFQLQGTDFFLQGVQQLLPGHLGA